MVEIEPSGADSGGYFQWLGWAGKVLMIYEACHVSEPTLSGCLLYRKEAINTSGVSPGSVPHRPCQISEREREGASQPVIRCSHAGGWSLFVAPGLKTNNCSSP